MTRLAACLLALALTACAALATSTREDDGDRVDVILPPMEQEGPGPSPTPIATRSPSGVDLPFAPGHEWSGTYSCATGPIPFHLRIERVQGTRIEATLRRADAGWTLAGTYDPGSGAMDLSPIDSSGPPGAAVGLLGTVSEDGTIFEGRVTDPTCASFSAAR